MFDDGVFDLDAARTARSATAGKPIPLRFGGRVICELPPELPIDALEPFTHVNVDLTWLVRKALDTIQAETDPDIVAIVGDLLVQSPNIPAEFVQAAKASARRIMTGPGYDAFVAARPSLPDVVALVKGLVARYRVRLGESSTSSDGSGDGSPSKPTSDTSMASTSMESGSVPESPASSASTAF